jgi:type I restriction enzyme, S subunit
MNCGYPFKYIGELVAVKGGKRLPQGESYSTVRTAHPYLRVCDFSSSSIDDSDLKFISPETHSKISRYVISSDDVYISIAGTIGLAGIVPSHLSGSNLTENAAKLVIHNHEILNRNYLSWYLNTIGQNEIQQKIKATSQPKLALFRIEEISIPLPPIGTQKRIAAILDQAEALRSLRRQSIGQLDALARSVFLEMFGDPATNPNKLSIIKLGELTRITSGSTPSRTISENFIGSIPWVKTTEVCGNLILETEEKISELALKNSSCHIYPTGSIIVALYGQGKTRGRAAILGIDAATNQACGVLLPHVKYNTQFLFWQLQLSYDRLRELGRGGNQPNLNLGLLGDFYVLLPPLALQQEFADRIGAIEALKAQHRESLAKLDALFASLQHRAFRGEL